MRGLLPYVAAKRSEILEAEVALTWRWGVFLLLVLLACPLVRSASAASPTPSLRLNAGANLAHPSGTQSPRASRSVSAIIPQSRILSPQSRAATSKSQGQESSSGGDFPAWLQAIAGILLVGFAMWQMHFVRRTTAAAENAANAARDNARAAIDAAIATQRYVELSQQMVEAAKQSARAAELTLNSERPYLFVEKPSLTHEKSANLPTIVPNLIGPPKADQIYLSAKFQLYNRGKGVAIFRYATLRLIAVRGGIFRSRQKLRPSEAIALGHYRAKIHTQVIGPNESSDRAFVQSFRLSIEQWEMVKRLEVWLFVVIHVQYADVFKRPYPARFVFDYNPPVVLENGVTMGGWLAATREEYIRYK